MIEQASIGQTVPSAWNVGRLAAWAEWNLQFDVNGHISGVSLSSDGKTSDFVINADTFGAGRMMFALARQGQAPAALGRTTARGVPIAAVLIMIGALAVGVVLNAVVPESAFAVVASLATFATVWVWLMILLAHLGMRRRMRREGAQADRFPVPLWPVGPWLAVAFIVGVIVLLAVFPATRIALVVGVVWLILLGAAWAIRRRA